MTYSIIYEKISDGSFPQGYYYAHIPALDITTHGLGIDGARESAQDLARLWIEEKSYQLPTVPPRAVIVRG